MPPSTCTPPKISTSWSVEPVNITLYGKNDSADVVKLKGLEMGRLCWIIQVGPNSTCPCKKQAEGGLKQTEEEKVR